MVAFALRADGWHLRSEIIWCLSGGTWLYARTQKGDMPIMVRDLARLKPETVQLWSGEKWTQALGWSRSCRQGIELEIVLRSGERISCTPTHQWPTNRGLLQAGDLRAGDHLTRTQIPEPDEPLDTTTIGEDVAWFVGLYIAEGSRSGDTIQIAGHSKEVGRLLRLQKIAREWGGACTFDVCGNKQSIRLYGKMLNALLDQFVSGRTAKDKGLAPVCWRYSNRWLTSLLLGYLSGDGHFDAKNERYRLGFCRNYNLERDLRTLAARLGCRLVLKPTTAAYNGKRVPIFRGELRPKQGNHHNCKPTEEVAEIRKARCREVYDIGVADEPHLYALASGILTHNSKPNPMPESVTDRPTKAHEQIFLLAKSQSYFYDAEAIKEPAIADHDAGNTSHRGADLYAAGDERHRTKVGLVAYAQRMKGRGGRNAFRGQGAERDGDNGPANRDGREMRDVGVGATRNKRSVWEIATSPFPEAHFATFPPKLVEPCILAGTSEKGCCPECGAPWERVTEQLERPPAVSFGGKHGTADPQSAAHRIMANTQARRNDGAEHDSPFIGPRTIGWRPTCKHEAEPIPCTVLDPFSGAGTTLLVAMRLGRSAIGVELNAKYAAMAKARIEGDRPLFVSVAVQPSCDTTDTSRSGSLHGSLFPHPETLEKVECDE
jgi:hypothetical protein